MRQGTQAGDSAVPARGRRVGAAVHVCDILMCFSISEPALTLTQVASQVRLGRSSVYQLLSTLVATGFVTFDSGSKLYRLGSRLAHLGAVYRQSTPLVVVATPVLERLRDATGETASLHLPVRGGSMCVVEVASTHPIRMMHDSGRVYPLYNGAAGHVLRAFAAAWEDNADAARLQTIREQGFAATRGEQVVPGGAALFAPIRGSAGKVVGAVGIHGPAFRLPEHKLVGFLPPVLQAAARLEALAVVDPAGGGAPRLTGADDGSRPD